MTSKNQLSGPGEQFLHESQQSIIDTIVSQAVYLLEQQEQSSKVDSKHAKQLYSLNSTEHLQDIPYILRPTGSITLQGNIIHQASLSGIASYIFCAPIQKVFIHHISIFLISFFVCSVNHPTVCPLYLIRFLLLLCLFSSFRIIRITKIMGLLV